MNRRAFSLMEMMVVLLIVAIVAAASAPMVSKKLSGASSATGMGCYWKSFENEDKDSITYNSVAKPYKSVIIGAKKTDLQAGSTEKPRLFIKSNSNSNPHIRLLSHNITDGDINADIAVTSRKTYWFSSGDSSQAGPNSVVIGHDATVGTSIGAIAIGGEAEVSSSGGSVAIGSAFSAYSFSGSGAQAGQSSVAIGSSSEAENNATAVGYSSKATNSYATALGYNSTASNSDSIAIGSATASGIRSVAIGKSSTTTNPCQASTDGIGIKGYANGTSSVAIGDSSLAGGSSGVAVGASSSAGQYSVAYGGNSKASSSGATAVGYNSTASGLYDLALGYGSNASGGGSIAIGDSTASAGSSVVLGDESTASGLKSIAIGCETSAKKPGGIAIGSNATVNGDNGIAIGNVIAGANEVKLGTDSHKVYLGGCTFQNGVIKAKRIEVEELNVGSSGFLADKTGASLTNLTVTNLDTINLDTSNLYVSNNANIGSLDVRGNADLNINSGSTCIRATGTHGKIYSMDDDAGDRGYLRIINDCDRRLKNVGEVFTAGLEEIKKLEVFNYVYKKDSTKTPHVGVMAQDLMKIFPNAVFKGDDGFYRIRMEDMFYALVNAVKELDKKIDLLAEKQKEIETLRAEVKSLKKDYADLEKRIEKLEKRK